jgi:hypothetical protein
LEYGLKLGEAIFEKEPASVNVLVTPHHQRLPNPKDGEAAESRFPYRSAAHQDGFDNIMVVTSGAKLWSLANLEKEQSDRVKGGSELKGSLTIHAADKTMNNKVQLEIANLFTSVLLEPGDILFVPANVWHEVLSEPGTLAISIMYVSDKLQGQGDSMMGEPAGGHDSEEEQEGDMGSDSSDESSSGGGTDPSDLEMVGAPGEARH